MTAVKVFFVSLFLLSFICLSQASDDPFFKALQNQLETLNSDQIFGTLSCGYSLMNKLTLQCDLEQLTLFRLSILRLDSIPSSISLHSQSLKNISINSGLLSFADAFSFLTNLTYLNLGKNHLNSIPPFFSSFTKLHALVLNSNSLSTLPDELSSLTLLRTLDLGYNHLTSIPQFISSFTVLSELRWNSNSLSTFSDELSSLSLMRTLDLSSNHLTSIPQFFSSFKNMNYLRLDSNTLSTLPDELSSLTLLSTLNLCSNHLTSIPQFFSSFKNMNYLKLDSNSLSTLPVELSSLLLLTSLYLQNNPSLQANTELFKEMKLLKNLNVLNTLISGLFPEVETFYCASSCISSSRCRKNLSCPCSSFFAEFCQYPCGKNSQQLCVDCSSLVSKQQCSGDCSWCSGNKDDIDCYWCDYERNRCSDSSKCLVCSGYSTPDRCESSGCDWCTYDYCVGNVEECVKVCSNLGKEKCETDIDCLWCSSYSICLDSTSQCLTCDRFTSEFCPPGCDCLFDSSGSNSTVIIVICITCVVFVLSCVCLFVLFVLKKRTAITSIKMNSFSHYSSSLRFEKDFGVNESSEHPLVSRYSECCVDSLFQVSPPFLSFSSSDISLKLCAPATAEFELSNICGIELVVDCLFLKGFKEKHGFVFSPSSFTIRMNEKRKISVEMTMNCSATLSPSKSLICCGISTKQQWCSLCGIQAQSELSPLLSCDDIQLKSEIGRGAFGKVFLGSFKGTEVAIKVSNGMSIEDFNTEAETLSKLHSPHIVAFYGISQTLNAMVIEYCKYGSVEDYYSKHSLKKEMKNLICFDISRGMKYLHLNEIIHRDLKPANVLLSSLSNDLNASRAKISDFGTSRSSMFTMKMTRGVGTPSFMAPEIFDTQEYGRSSDIYAFGMTIWSIFAQKTPFEEESMSSIIILLSKGKRPPLLSSTICDLNDLIERCWDQNPHQRPSFEEITEHLHHLIGMD